jgi:hypothetical protein
MRAKIEATPREPVLSRRRLFKTDHPRGIDRYIDYFGGATSDPCGEALLDSLGDPDPRPRVASNA